MPKKDWYVNVGICHESWTCLHLTSDSHMNLACGRGQEEREREKERTKKGERERKKGPPAPKKMWMQQS